MFYVPLAQVAGDEDALRALFPHQGSRLLPRLALYVHDCYCGRALAGHFDGSSPAHALASACDQANSIRYQWISPLVLGYREPGTVRRWLNLCVL